MAGQYLVLFIRWKLPSVWIGLVAKTNSGNILRYGRTSVVHLAVSANPPVLIPINLGSFSSVKRSQFPWNNCRNGDTPLLVSPRLLSDILSFFPPVSLISFARRLLRNDFLVEIDPRRHRIFLGSREQLSFYWQISTASCFWEVWRNEIEFSQCTEMLRMKYLKYSTTYD